VVSNAHDVARDLSRIVYARQGGPFDIQSLSHAGSMSAMAMFRQSRTELKKYGLLLVVGVIPHNDLISNSYLSRVQAIKPMPMGA
jgi:hypothetical protein